MSQDKNLNLSEAAMEILNANRKSKDSGQDSFGLGQKLNDTIHGSAQNVGNPGLEKPAVNGPTATPPGQTPPVGSEAGQHLSAQPANKTISNTDVDQIPSKTSTEPAGDSANNPEAAKKLKSAPAKTVNPTGAKTGGFVNEEEETNEDIAALMAGENLSEEFKRKATAIFEAAVKTKVAELAEELEAQYVAQFEEAYEEMKEDFATKVDEYLDYVAESWMEENKLAVESGLRTEIAEGFIDSLKTVFEEHYIDIPEEKFDVVEELASKVEALERQVNEEMTKNIDLKQKLSEQKKVEALHSVCEGLTLSQAEKIKTIAESVEFVSESDFVDQIEAIKESYFSVATVKPASIESLNDVVNLNEEKETKAVDPLIAAYASRISKTLLK
jgi:hypothetical protein